MGDGQVEGELFFLIIVVKKCFVVASVFVCLKNGPQDVQVEVADLHGLVEVDWSHQREFLFRVGTSEPQEEFCEFVVLSEDELFNTEDFMIGKDGVDLFEMGTLERSHSFADTGPEQSQGVLQSIGHYSPDARPQSLFRVSVLEGQLDFYDFQFWFLHEVEDVDLFGGKGLLV